MRQTFLHYLIDDVHYPKGLLAVEHSIKVGELAKRCDAVVFSEHLQPLCIIECKAQEVPLTQQVFDQVAVYNRKLGVAFFIITNGQKTYVCHVTDTCYEFLQEIPQYNQLQQWKS